MKGLCRGRKVLVSVTTVILCLNLCTGVAVHAQESEGEITEQNEQAETENNEVSEEIQENPDDSKEEEEKADETPGEMEQREVLVQENKEQVESGEQLIRQSIQGEELSAQSDSGKCGENVTWSYENGTLTISGSGPMEDYDRSEKPWEDYCDSLAVGRKSGFGIQMYCNGNCSK